LGGHTDKREINMLKRSDKKKSRSSNTARNSIPASLEKRLLAYAAAAAGVVAVASVNPAEAEVVYTPANTSILVDGIVRVDLNHDGVTDLSFIGYYYATRSNTLVLKRVTLSVSGEVRGSGSALPASVLVGSSQLFEEGRAMAKWTTLWYTGKNSFKQSTRGPWGNQTDRYLGVKFTIKGEIHYGWVRLTVSRGEGTMTGYAYETVPGAPIFAGRIFGSEGPGAGTGAENLPATPVPSPATLGRLAQGARGLSAWRF
jgi:hypothetical protein